MAGGRERPWPELKQVYYLGGSLSTEHFSVSKRFLHLSPVLASYRECLALQQTVDRRLLILSRSFWHDGDTVGTYVKCGRAVQTAPHFISNVFLRKVMLFI